jgi:hypothetical protein
MRHLKLLLLSPLVFLVGCNDGIHSYMCDGVTTNGEIEGNKARVVYAEETMPFKYSCFGTNAATWIPAAITKTGGCTLKAGNFPEESGYISAHETIVTLGKSATSFNPRTMKIRTVLQDGYYGGGNTRIFEGVCK